VSGREKFCGQCGGPLHGRVRDHETGELLVEVEVHVVPDDIIEPPDPTGPRAAVEAALIKEAEQIAYTLSDTEIEILRGRGMFHVDLARRLIRYGLVARLSPYDTEHVVTAAGRLVLSLCGRKAVAS
jgi:hypothetical protein